jgi:hypothetical protein
VARKKTDPSQSLARFIFGIFDFHHDRGMPQKTAKTRMINDTLTTCSDIIKNEEEVPDHMLVIYAQNLRRSISTRGAQITKNIEAKYPKGNQVPESELLALRNLKALQDSADTFIENYKGWVSNGTEEES